LLVPQVVVWAVQCHSRRGISVPAWVRGPISHGSQKVPLILVSSFTTRPQNAGRSPPLHVAAQHRRFPRQPRVIRPRGNSTAPQQQPPLRSMMRVVFLFCWQALVRFQPLRMKNPLSFSLYTPPFPTSEHAERVPRSPGPAEKRRKMRPRANLYSFFSYPASGLYSVF